MFFIVFLPFLNINEIHQTLNQITFIFPLIPTKIFYKKKESSVHTVYGLSFKTAELINVELFCCTPCFHFHNYVTI